MSYTVEWVQQAQNDLASIWLAAPNRNAVAAANARLDRLLARVPLRTGRQLTSSVHRRAYSRPLVIEFEVIEDDKRVLVQAVWVVG